MDQGTIIRGGFFIGGFVLFGLLQWIIPSRKFERDRWQFMASNLGVVVVNNLMLALVPLIPCHAPY